MVVFTCNHCGESLKKNHVDKHFNSRCRNNSIFVSCMDCFKDFDKVSFNTHIQCVTEAERYSGKDYVAKASQNKGQRKQEAWLDMVRGISEKKKNISQGVKSILTTISTYDNIPRKKAKFLNFMTNSFRYMKSNELEQAWTLLEEAMKENREENPVPVQNGKQANGNANAVNNENQKRKLEEESKNEEETPAKKIKTDVTEETETPAEATATKFNWKEAIKTILSAKNNELKLTKLKKKVLKQYQSLTGSEISDKIENTFNKKIAKLKGVVVDNDKVRLIE